MAVSAVNPNLSASTTAPRRYDLVDGDLQLRAPSAAAISATTAETAVELKAEKLSYYKAVVQYSAIGGTVDASNYWTVNIEASANNSTFVVVGSQKLAAAADRLYIALEGEAVAAAMDVAAQGEALYVRVRAVETGTTAGNLDYFAYLTL